jgi:plasmid replication initiation protein
MVTQHKPLITVSNDLIIKARLPRLTVNEQRLVLYMLSLVDKGDQEFYVYRISVQELDKITGTKHKDSYSQFDEITDGLMSKIIRFTDPEHDYIDRKVSWCSYAGLAKGKGYVEMSFDPHLKPFLLTLKNNFTQYELRAVIKLKNHYSLRMYQLIKRAQGLERVNHKNFFTAEIEWLKDYLSIEPGKYSAFGHFNSKVLKPCKKDIEKNTDLLFKYEPIKSGRKYTQLRFTWKDNPDYNQQDLFSAQSIMENDISRSIQSTKSKDDNKLTQDEFIDQLILELPEDLQTKLEADAIKALPTIATRFEPDSLAYQSLLQKHKREIFLTWKAE